MPQRLRRLLWLAIIGLAVTLVPMAEDSVVWRSLAALVQPEARNLPRVVRPGTLTSRPSLPARSASLTGPVRVRDGDTIVVAGTPVRLSGLHCPENDEVLGRRATARMRDLVSLGPVSCALSGERTYDRKVGRCAAGGRDLAAVLIAEGFCARCPRYDAEGRYAAAQGSAAPWLHGLPGYCRLR